MYSEDEVAALIEWWSEFRHNGHLWVLVRYADLSRAISALPPKELHTVIALGGGGLNQRDAADALGVAQSTVSERYVSAVTWITNYLNTGGTSE